MVRDGTGRDGMSAFDKQRGGRREERVKYLGRREEGEEIVYT